MKKTIIKSISERLTNIDPRYGRRTRKLLTINYEDDLDTWSFFLDGFLPAIETGILIRDDSTETILSLINLAEQSFTIHGIPVLVFDALDKEATFKDGLEIILDHAKQIKACEQQWLCSEAR